MAPGSKQAITAAIGTAIAAKASTCAGGGRTAPKFPTIKQVLREAVSGFPADAKLPTVREIALSLNTTIVPVQRAILELAGEGVLYTRPRAGVFVGKEAPAIEPGAPPPGASPFSADCLFATDSALPFQRQFWQELASGFQQRYRHTRIDIRYAPDSPHRNEGMDAYERSGWSRHWRPGGDDVLPLEDFAEAGRTGPAVARRFVPLYYRTHLLFFNRNLLRSLGLPLPDFTSFAQQADYLRELAPRLAAAGLEPHPASIQEPITMLGASLDLFLELVRQPAAARAPAAVARVEADIVRLVDFCCGLRWDDPSLSRADAFLAGRCPFYLGYSVDFWTARVQPPPFDWGAYPMLRLDDTFTLCPIVGALNRNAAHPVEALRFLAYLGEPGAQRRLVETGNFAATLDPLPPFAGDPDWLRETLARTRPLYLIDREDYYLAINVLNGELSPAVHAECPGSDSLRQAYGMGSSYLAIRAAAQPPR